MLYNVNFCQLIDNRFLICFQVLYDSQFMWTFNLHFTWFLSLLVILAENRVKLNVAAQNCFCGTQTIVSVNNVGKARSNHLRFS